MNFWYKKGYFSLLILKQPLLRILVSLQGPPAHWMEAGRWMFWGRVITGTYRYLNFSKRLIDGTKEYSLEESLWDFFHKERKTQCKVQQKDSKWVKDLFVLLVLLEQSKVGEVNVEKWHSEYLLCSPGPSKIHSY